MSRIAYRVLLIVTLVVSLAVTVIFASRAMHYRHVTSAGSEAIRPWMSIPYIAHSRHVPAGVLWKALGMPPHGHDRRPVGRIAREQGKPVEELITKLREAIAEAQRPGGTL